MRGHIVKRYKTSYTIVLNLGHDPVTGKRKQQWISLKGTKKEAEKRLTEILHQLDTGTFMKPNKVTVGAYLEQWLMDYCKANLAPHTAQIYEFFVHQHLIPTLGQIPLTSLRSEAGVLLAFLALTPSSSKDNQHHYKSNNYCYSNPNRHC